MKTKIKLFALSAAVASVAAAVGINSGCYGTPANACFAAHGSHLVRYYPQSGTPTTGPCSQDPATGNPNLYGELVGVEAWLGAPDGTGPDGGGGTFNGVEYYHPDYNHLTIGLESTTLADAPPGDTTDSPISIATFGPLPNDAGICTTGTFPPAEQNIPQSTLMDGGIMPAFDVIYQWSNFQMVSTPAIQGTQWSATLVYTDKANNCTGTYTAIGISPGVGCARCACSDGTNCNPDGTCNGTAMPGTVPDNRVCNPTNANLPIGIAASGIDPLFPVYCDPRIFQCVLVDTNGAPAIPDSSPGWYTSASWLSDAG